MHRNISRAYNCLQDEHKRVRTACVKFLSRNDRTIERELLRANPNDAKHHDQVLLYEESLSRRQRRRVLGLNTYGRKIERLTFESLTWEVHAGDTGTSGEASTFYSRGRIGWGGWTRTNTVLINSEVSYQLDHAPAVPRL
jgi:hypothetical protein